MFSSARYLEIIDLSYNNINTISPQCFSALTLLKALNLTFNFLTTVHDNMWVGLQSLGALDLSNNHLIVIPPHGLSNMPALQYLWLSSNSLRTLRADVFNLDDYPDSHGCPPYLELTLIGNALKCDEELCWIKEAEEAGYFHFYSSTQCTNRDGTFYLKSIELGCFSGKNNIIP